MKTSSRRKWRPIVVVLAVAALALAQQTLSAQGKGEDEIKQAFAQLQSAIKAKAAGKVWALVDSFTQADAEKIAGRVKAVYKKANEKDKAEHEKNLGLTADEFAKLDGPMLFKTKRFLGKYDEIPDSKITGITVQGESATLNFLEPDGDKEKLIYTREDGKWKVAMPMPKFTK